MENATKGYVISCKSILCSAHAHTKNSCEKKIWYEPILTFTKHKQDVNLVFLTFIFWQVLCLKAKQSFYS